MLLHIGDTTRWTTIDPLLAGLCVLAFAAAATLVWAPLTRRRAFRRRLAQPLMVGALLVAVFPSVVPYDHLFPPDTHAGIAHAGADDVHATHCHTAPGSCSDAPVSSGSGQFLMSDPLLGIPALTALAIILTIPVLAGISSRPVLRPPLLAS